MFARGSSRNLALHALHQRGRGFARSALSKHLHRLHRISEKAGKLTSHLLARLACGFRHLRIAQLSRCNHTAVVILLGNFLSRELLLEPSQPLGVLLLNCRCLLLLGREVFCSRFRLKLCGLVGIFALLLGDLIGFRFSNRRRAAVEIGARSALLACLPVELRNSLFSVSVDPRESLYGSIG